MHKTRFNRSSGRLSRRRLYAFLDQPLHVIQPMVTHECLDAKVDLVRRYHFLGGLPHLFLSLRLSVSSAVSPRDYAESSNRRTYRLQHQCFFVSRLRKLDWTRNPIQGKAVASLKQVAGTQEQVNWLHINIDIYVVYMWLSHESDESKNSGTCESQACRPLSTSEEMVWYCRLLLLSFQTSRCSPAAFLPDLLCPPSNFRVRRRQEG